MNTQTIIKNKKQCSKCKTWKEIEQFGKQTESSTGLCSWCKDCRRNNLSEYRKTAQGKTTNNKYNNKRREIVESKEYQQIYRLKKFNLLVEEYENLLKGQDNQCAICKKEFIKTPHIDHNIYFRVASTTFGGDTAPGWTEGTTYT